MLYGKDGKGIAKPNQVCRISGYRVWCSFKDYKRDILPPIGDDIAGKLKDGEVVIKNGLKFKPIGNGHYRVYNLER